jgi:hypothetical protein
METKVKGECGAETPRTVRLSRPPFRDLPNHYATNWASRPTPRNFVCANRRREKAQNLRFGLLRLEPVRRQEFLERGSEIVAGLLVITELDQRGALIFIHSCPRSVIEFDAGSACVASE